MRTSNGVKRKPLAGYFDILRNILVEKRDYQKAKRYGQTLLKQLDKLTYTPRELFLLYSLLGDTYSTLNEYSHSIDYYYKAYLIGLKEHLKPAEVAHLSIGMAGSFIMTQHIEQALNHLNKIQEYYRQYGDQTEPMNKRQYFFALINLAYCYLYKSRGDSGWQGKGIDLRQSELDKAGEIITGQLGANESFLQEYKLCHMDYYHLKGEYLVERGEYSQARQAFEEAIRVSRTADFFTGELEARLHLAILLLLDKKIDDAVAMLLTLYDEAGKSKSTNLMCEAGLLLSKCYSLQEQPEKSTAIEKRIKPLLKNLDISWFYEKTREFDELYKLLQPIYKSSKYTPLVLVNGVDKHYEKSSYKDILVGRSVAMQKVYQLTEKIAGTDLPVLVQGETGTGKELICRFLHQRSARAEKPYLTLDCGALPENLLENELFGHIAGAYTGATDDKKGYVELASGGTLMLDEITNMSASMQMKLLRVLEEKQIWPLGAERSVPVDTRFVFASNQNVEQMMAKGLLRSDLFYRINVVIITIPSLKERREDIPLLIEHFLGKYGQGLRTANSELRIAESEIRISQSALRILVDYSWPGNVRELENEIQKICVLHQGEKVTEEMLSETIRYTPPTPSQEGRFKSPLIRGDKGVCYRNGRTLIQLRDEFEREIINQTIKEHKGNIAEASRQLGYDRPSLYRKMKQLGLKQQD